MNYKVESVEMLLNAGADATRQDAHRGETVLHVVAQCQDRTRGAKLVGMLLAWRSKEGAALNANAKDNEAYTPLMKAAQFGGAGAAACLLEKGQAEVNYATERGATALLLACLNLRVRCVEVLLNAGADINATAGGRSAEDLALAADEMKQEQQGEEAGCQSKVLSLLAWARLAAAGGAAGEADQHPPLPLP